MPMLMLMGREGKRPAEMFCVGVPEKRGLPRDGAVSSGASRGATDRRARRAHRSHRAAPGSRRGPQHLPAGRVNPSGPPSGLARQYSPQ